MIVNTATLLEKFLSSTGVSTDTRKIQAGNLFFALKGPNFNANAMAKEALEKGAQYAIIDDADYLAGERTLLVKDGLLALQALATAYRQTLTIPIVGLTGSNGKTTTKELIFSVLSQKYHCFATTGNLNNHIGVPLSVLSIKKEHEIAVIEMGANKQGDIKELVDIAQPTHGLITNIGKAHLEGFGGIEGVRKGKGELLDFLKASGGITFLPQQASAVTEMYQERGMNKSVIVNEALPTTLVEAKPMVRYSLASGEVIDSHLPGIYNFENIQLAIAVGKFFQLSDEQCNRGIETYIPNNHRSQFIKIGSNQVLMDAYNANPSSMSAAISHFAETEGTPKIIILGDMFELGDSSASEHAALGQLIAPLGFEKVLLVGSHMQHALVHLPSAYYFPDKFGLHTWLQDHPITDSFLLVKGSRGIQLESVLAFLENSK
ncbi:UDP-N-acetylmuramoyl-tripeptide--D-alanyl-D-alanine ligase [Aquirufa novilacunae]|jgi:UDP-N-acetylmuramoyl-tripeptide--D-alanyl-D-alanine ligase|uniref:UDP-N-acetylmuramoyl-tripeptide--D-alanyl-D-alanine ligase n=1 Tax=Aquirufa novilacunae TaxID=3139305 RepID=A0ABW8U2C9_9BACT